MAVPSLSVFAPKYGVVGVAPKYCEIFPGKSCKYGSIRVAPKYSIVHVATKYGRVAPATGWLMSAARRDSREQ